LDLGESILQRPPHKCHRFVIHRLQSHPPRLKTRTPCRRWCDCVDWPDCRERSHCPLLIRVDWSNMVTNGRINRNIPTIGIPDRSARVAPIDKEGSTRARIGEVVGRAVCPPSAATRWAGSACHKPYCDQRLGAHTLRPLQQNWCIGYGAWRRSSVSRNGPHSGPYTVAAWPTLPAYRAAPVGKRTTQEGVKPPASRNKKREQARESGATSHATQARLLPVVSVTRMTAGRIWRATTSCRPYHPFLPYHPCRRRPSRRRARPHRPWASP